MAKKEITEETIKKMYAACIKYKDNPKSLQVVKDRIVDSVERPDLEDIFDVEQPSSENTKKELTALDEEALNIAAALELQVKYADSKNPDIKEIVDGMIPALQSNDLEKLLDLEQKLSDFSQKSPKHEFVIDSSRKLFTGSDLDPYQVRDNLEQKILQHPDLLNNEMDIDKVLVLGKKLESFVNRQNKSSFKKMEFKIDVESLNQDLDKKAKSFEDKGASKQEITEFMIKLHNSKSFLEEKGVDVKQRIKNLEKLRGKGLATPEIFNKHSATDIAKLIEAESKKIGTDKQNDKPLNGKETCRAVLSSVPYESWGKMHEVAKELDKREAARGSAIGRVVQSFSDAIASLVSKVSSIGKSTSNKDLKALANSFNASLKESKSKSGISNKLQDQAKKISQEMKESGANKVVTKRPKVQSTKDVSGMGRQI